jgi:hypothetical protein
MPRKNETEITIPTYQKYWIYDHENGHDIVIAADTGKTTIKLRWPTRQRDANGRVRDKK